MHRRGNDKRRERRSNLLDRWFAEAKERSTIRRSEALKNETDRSITANVTGHGVTGIRVGNGSIESSSVNETQGMDFGNFGQGPDGGRDPFAFLRDIIPDDTERISGDYIGDDDIHFVPTDSNGNAHTPEEVDVQGHSSDLGKYYDIDTNDDDPTVRSHEEEYEEAVAQLGRAMASKFVSGIHRYDLMLYYYYFIHLFILLFLF
jgi:hypothetical protein